MEENSIVSLFKCAFNSPFNINRTIDEAYAHHKFSLCEVFFVFFMSFSLCEPPKNNSLSNYSLLALLSIHFVKSCFVLSYSLIQTIIDQFPQVKVDQNLR